MKKEKLLNLLAKRHKKKWREYRSLLTRKRLRLSDLSRMQSLAEDMASLNRERARIAKELNLRIIYS